MIELDLQSLQADHKYKFLTSSIVPRPIALVTSLSEEGTLNAAPFSFFNIVSADPPYISISVQRTKEGKRKDTACNIALQKEFVVHVTTESNVDAVNLSSIPFPADRSELPYAGFNQVASKLISTPGIAESPVRLECELVQMIELGEEDQVTSDLIIGKVVYAFIQSNLYKDGFVNSEALQPVSRLGGKEYGKLGQTFELTRPEHPNTKE